MDQLAKLTLERYRVAIFIVAYNAEQFIVQVLERIPSWVAERVVEIYLIDDSSQDATIDTAQKVTWPPQFAPLRIFKTPYNQGYGGNQRLGYLYAIQRNFDIVVLLHGDGQYAPECLPRILAPYSDPEGADAVYGSRFLRPIGALRGGMPVYKWLGNRVLTRLQNLMLGTKMSEMHCGYRSYKTEALRKVPFHQNSLGFDFDADIIIQLVAAGLRIREVPIPTYYGDEISYVNGLKYAFNCITAALRYRLMEYGLFYDPKFDISTERNRVKYVPKSAATTLHYFVRTWNLPPGSSLLDFGAGDGSATALHHAGRGVWVTCLDRDEHMPRSPEGIPKTLKKIVADLDQSWIDKLPDATFDNVVALDILEHLSSPEATLRQIFQVMQPGGKLFASTGNVAYFPLRIMLLLGQFNYGRRGILDLTHKRLFTVGSFRRLLQGAGFRVEKILGFGPPIADLVAGNSRFLRMIDRLGFRLAQQIPSLFAYQMLMTCTRPDSVTSTILLNLSEGAFLPVGVVAPGDFVHDPLRRLGVREDAHGARRSADLPEGPL
jgi:glycosyltransferase involved in cell wall biosynthesis